MRLSREAWASGRGKLFVVSLIASDRSTGISELRSAHSPGAPGCTRTGAMANWGWSTGTSGHDDRIVSWHRSATRLSQDWTLMAEGDWSQFVQNTTTENRTHGPAHELTAIESGRQGSVEIPGHLSQQ